MNDSDPTTSATADPSKRRRTISNLTEEQIRHKRDVDRRAQRALRQRNKECIANLEKQYEQLQEMTRVKEAQWQQEIQELRAQNRALVRCLDNIASLASVASNEIPDDGATTDEAASQADNNLYQRSEDQGNVIQSQDNIDNSLEAGVSNQEMPLPPEAIYTDSPIATVRPDHEVHPDRTPEFTPNGASSTIGRAQPDFEPPSNVLERQYHIPTPLPANYDITITGEHFQTDPTHTDGPHATSTDPCLTMLTPLSTATTDPNCSSRTRTVASVLPSHTPPTCPLDNILLDFLSTRRDMLSRGEALDSIMGPDKPTAKAMIYPELAPSVHGISRVMSEILLTFPYVPQPEKLAFFSLMSKTMKWQINSTKENYLAMPAWLRPTVAQISVPHAAWIDNIPWPGVRDILIENPEEYTFELFSEYYSQNVTVNWQYDGLDAISDLKGDAILHSIFEKHIGNLKNWTVSSAFQGRFPGMTPAIYSRD